MTTKKKKAPRPHKAGASSRPATDTGLYTMHGAFKKKADAQKKARAVGGFYRGGFIKAGGDYRYVVMSRDAVPF